MSAGRRAALVIDGGSPFVEATVEAVSARFEHVIVAAPPGGAAPAKAERAELEPSSGESWNRLSARIREQPPGLKTIIHCAPPSETIDASERNIAAMWLALREAIRLFPEGEGGVYLSQHIAPRDSGPHHEAEIEAARLAGDCALIDAMRIGRHPRVNRLILDPAADPRGAEEAIGFLVDDRSRFMTGAELSLDAARADNVAALNDKTVLVTGATSGLGRSTAIEAGALGAFVAVGGRKTGLAEETLELVRERGGDGMTVALDVTKPGDWRAAVDAIAERRGSLHGLVNNAGEARHGRIDTLNASDLEFLLAINYRGTMLGMSAAEGLIAASGGGSIVNISSVAGVRGGPGAAAYSASKAAVVGLSRARGRALAGHPGRIRVNALQPGLIWTGSVAESLGEDGAREFRQRIEPQTPLGRVATSEDIAWPICFLLSDAAAAITGQAINVSGGLEISFP